MNAKLVFGIINKGEILHFVQYDRGSFGVSQEVYSKVPTTFSKKLFEVGIEKKEQELENEALELLLKI